MSPTHTSAKTSAAPERPKYYPRRAADTPRWARAAQRAGALATAPADWLLGSIERALEAVRRRLAGPSPEEPEAGSAKAPASAGAAEAAGRDELVVLDPDLAAALSAVPGLGHWFGTGDLRRCAAFFAAWTALAAWILLLPPPGGGRVFFMGLFAFHQWIMLDSHDLTSDRLELPRLRSGARIRRSLLAVALLSLVYGTAGAALQGCGAIVTVDTDVLAPAFRRGDHLWVGRQRAYARGDLVLSRAHGGIERVVAVAGDALEVTAEGVLLNGEPLPASARPVSEAILSHPNLRGARLTVPPNRYCVFFPARHYWLFKNELLERFIVPGAALGGKVRFRYFPRPEAFQ